MVDGKRPFQDESIILPCFRQIYSACYMGHASGDPHEEPVKYTQALMERSFLECTAEWLARLDENTIAAHKYITGELEEEIAAAKKMEKLMASTGMSEMAKEFESGGDMETVEAGMDIVDETALDALEEILTEDAFNTYGFHPPIINLPIRLNPSINVMLYGNDVDNFYNYMDGFTLENVPYLENWHYEDGIQTTRICFVYENAESVLERRHLRTGEKFRYLCCQRSVVEGERMVKDITMDIRNERTPQYSNSMMFGFAVDHYVTADAQFGGRSLFEIISTMIPMMASVKMGWPFTCYIGWLPERPGLLAMALELPIDMLAPRLISMLLPVNFWFGKYNLTHMDTHMEVYGQEAVIPTAGESASGYIRYGMDKLRYLPSYIQSKRAYGQEAQMRGGTIYPCPEKVIMGIEKAESDIVKVRKEHPEWLTDVKGFGI